MRKLLLLVASFLQAGGQTINIPIQNPSFEEPTRVSGPDRTCGFGGYEVPGWTGGVFAFRVAAGDPCGMSQPFPDGQYALDLMNGTTSQDLGVKPADGVYVLKFWVAGYFYWYPTTYSASLSVIGQKRHFCSTSGWVQGDWTEITMVCPAMRIAQPNILDSSGNLMISFSSEGPNGNYWPALFDNVSLAFTPRN